MFVIENVLGIRSAAGGEYLTRVQHEARILGREAGRPGYRVHGQVEDAWKLGVPQKRRRQLIIGVRADLSGYFNPDLKHVARADPCIPLGPCIADLPVLRAGCGKDERQYDLERRAGHLHRFGQTARRYLFNILEVERASKLTNHVARPHNARDLRDFARLKEGETSATAMRIRGVEFEFPYSKSSFKDRYTRQSRSEPCSTIVAHMSKDGLMFVHPTQNRSLTPREAARVQSFPDWFRFPSSRTQTYRLIGNAVPPLVAEAVGLAAKKFLRAQANTSVVLNRYRYGRGLKSAPCNHQHQYPPCRASEFPSKHNPSHELEQFAKLDRRALRGLPKDEFLRGWYALLFLFPELHPENALDHGITEQDWPECRHFLPGLAQKQQRRYARSGWPVALELVGREAWRRHEEGQLTDREIYCVVSDAELTPGGIEVLLS
jgi:DNA (cytosine-5)-methyltransferase 1